MFLSGAQINSGPDLTPPPSLSLNEHVHFVANPTHNLHCTMEGRTEGGKKKTPKWNGSAGAGREMLQQAVVPPHEQNEKKTEKYDEWQ
jgi:hypothetical protein